MKLVHVVPRIDRAAAGPSYSVPRLCESLAALGHDVEISCLVAGKPVAGVRVDVHRQWPILEGFEISSSQPVALRRSAGLVDVVHNHSLWSMVNVASGWAVPGRRAKLVTSPRGTLSPWALQRSRYVKKLLWPLQRRAVERADLLHATSEEEYGDIRALGFAAPVAIIPNGIDVPALRSANAEKREKSHRTLLFLSRIHPIKALDRLFGAWAELQQRHPDWRLVVAGHGEPAHVAEVHAMANELNLKRVSFPGPLYDAAKSTAFFDAKLFVLPTHTENFGVAVAEALAHGCPSVVSQGAPWSGLQENGCGWWVKNDVQTLTDTLGAAMSLPTATLAEMGAAGQRWMLRDFGWPEIGFRMAAAYSWLMGQHEKPEWVRID